MPAMLSALALVAAPGPTVIDRPADFGGLTAGGFYWIGGALLVGALAIALLLRARDRRR